MIEDIRDINRSDPISSINNRKIDDKILAELSNQYHTLLSLLGKVNTLSVCLNLTNASLVNMLKSVDEEEDKIYIDSHTEPQYPTSISEIDMAENISEYGIIIAKRINNRSIFVDDNDIIKPNIEIVRSTDNSLFLENPDKVIENSPKHAFEGIEPYIAQFVKNNMSRSNITIDVKSNSQPFLINAIKYIPMPMAGSIMLERLRYDGINPVILNGEVEFDETSIYDIHRTLPGYIHFEPVETSVMRITVTSELFNTSLNAVTVGISKIAGEYNTYASKSYIGYKVNTPLGYTKLKAVTMNKDGYTMSLNNISIKIYDSLDEFNNVSNRYLISCGTNQTVDIPCENIPLYFLVEIDSINNTTPSLSGISLEYM